jgi:effector-binding domain-containing protein
MAAEIEIRKVVPRPYVGIRRVVKHDGLTAACAEVFPQVETWLREKGVRPDGLALVYHSVNQATGDFDVQPSFFLRAPLAGEGEIAAGETAGGEALYALHLGPYSTLGETWGQVFARAAAMKRAVTKSSWEVYLNTPADAAPVDLRTEIYVPIDPVSSSS